jgi:hypothetical protein
VTATSTFARSMGQVIGITVFGAVFAAALLSAAGPGADPDHMAAMPDDAITSAVRVLYLAGMVPIAIALLLTWMIPEAQLRARSKGAGQAGAPTRESRPEGLHADEHLHPEDPSGVS